MECPARIFDRLESEGIDGRSASYITINDDANFDESTSEAASSAEVITPVQRRKRSRTEAGFRSDGMRTRATKMKLRTKRTQAAIRRMMTTMRRRRRGWSESVDLSTFDG